MTDLKLIALSRKITYIRFMVMGGSFHLPDDLSAIFLR